MWQQAHDHHGAYTGGHRRPSPGATLAEPTVVQALQCRDPWCAGPATVTHSEPKGGTAGC